MKNMKDIDPRERLSKEDFCTLFDQLPLNENEKVDVSTKYWGVYTICVDNGEVTPVEAWLATKNTFVLQETQVGERMAEQKPVTLDSL
jgi:hypothetical protein